MKKNSIVFSILLVLVLLAPTTLVRAVDDTEAADQGLSLKIGGSALLAIVTGSAGISLTLSGASQAGGSVNTSAADSTTRLRITSVVEPTKSRTVSAKLSAALTGSELVLSALKPTADFDFGNVAADYGTVKVGGVILTTSDQSIITGIKTCWSGILDDSGYVIKYQYNMLSTAAASKDVTVTYTLSEPA